MADKPENETGPTALQWVGERARAAEVTRLGSLDVKKFKCYPDLCSHHAAWINGEPVTVTLQVAASLMSSIASTYDVDNIEVLAAAAEMMGVTPDAEPSTGEGDRN